MNPNDIPISRQGIDKIKQLFRRVSFLEQRLAQFEGNTNSTASHYLIQAPTGGIPAKVGNKPGYALCTMVRRFSADGQTEKDLAEMATVQPVYNLGAAVRPNEFAVAHRDAWGDLFLSSGNSDSTDPDTPFRHTVLANSTETPIRCGTIFAPDLGGSISYKELPIGFQTSQLIPQAVVDGTLSFFNQELGEIVGTQYTTSFNGGYARAIVYMLDENHGYAVADGRGVYTQGIDKMALVSCPYGPYRILSYDDGPVDEEVAFPKFVRAVVKEQVRDRSIGFTSIIGIYSGQYLQFREWANIDDTDDDQYRFQLPEIESVQVNSAGQDALFRVDAVEDAPQPIYLVDVYFHGIANRDGNTGSTEQFTFSTSAGTQSFRTWASAIFELKAIGQKWDNTEETIEKTKFYLPQSDGVYASDQACFARLVFPWTERHKRIRFEVSSASAQGYSIEPTPGSDTIGGIVVHRLGDRGAGQANGMRSLEGFSIPEVGDVPVDLLFSYPGLYSNDGHTPSGVNNWHIDGNAGVLTPYSVLPTLGTGWSMFGLTFTLESGTLPPYANLNPITGAIYTSGITPLASPTSGSFVIKLVDAWGQTRNSAATLWEYVNE